MVSGLVFLVVGFENSNFNVLLELFLLELTLDVVGDARVGDPVGCAVGAVRFPL